MRGLRQGRRCDRLETDEPWCQADRPSRQSTVASAGPVASHAEELLRLRSQHGDRLVEHVGETVRPAQLFNVEAGRAGAGARIGVIDEKRGGLARESVSSRRRPTSRTRMPPWRSSWRGIIALADFRLQLLAPRSGTRPEVDHSRRRCIGRRVEVGEMTRRRWPTPGAHTRDAQAGRGASAHWSRGCRCPTASAGLASSLVNSAPAIGKAARDTCGLDVIWDREVETEATNRPWYERAPPGQQFAHLSEDSDFYRRRWRDAGVGAGRWRLRI